MSNYVDVAKLGFLACQQGNTNVRFMIYKKNLLLLFELEMSVETGYIFYLKIKFPRSLC